MNFISRTNYFRVKDEGVFRTWAAIHGLVVFPGGAPHPGHFALFPSRHREGRSLLGTEITEGLGALLAPDSVAVIIETGADGLRRIVGRAVAVNARGECVHLMLDAIYLLAAHAFELPEPTRAEH
jgi:hypothetical protein